MTEKKTPEAWCDQYGLEVRDPDGWRRDNTPFEQPITLPDFWSRYCASTARMLTEVQRDQIIADIRRAQDDPDSAPAEHVDPNWTGPNGLQLDILGAIIRIEQLNHEQPSDHYLWERIITCDIPRLYKHLDQHTRDWIAEPGNENVAELLVRRSALGAGELIADPIPPILCAECYTEVHFGKRETANPAVTVAGSNAACAEHLYFSSPALPDRTEGGIIIPGANGSGL